MQKALQSSRITSVTPYITYMNHFLAKCISLQDISTVFMFTVFEQESSKKLRREMTIVVYCLSKIYHIIALVVRQ